MPLPQSPPPAPKVPPTHNGELARRRRWLNTWVAGLGLLALLLAGLLIAELNNSERTDVGAAPRATQPAVATDQPALRVTVAPVMSPRSSLSRYRALTDELGRRLNRHGELILRDSYAEVAALLRTAHTDLAFVCTWAFVQGERDYGLELLAVPVMADDAQYRSVLVVRANSPLDSYKALKGRRVAAADPLSNTGWLYPSEQVRKLGFTTDHFFAKVIFTGGHDRSIRAVADGLVDAAAVDSLVLHELSIDDPGLARRVKVIARSETFGMPPVVVPHGLDPELKRAAQDALLSLQDSPSGRAALKSLRLARFDRPVAADYDRVRDMAARYREAHPPRPAP